MNCNGIVLCLVLIFSLFARTVSCEEVNQSAIRYIQHVRVFADVVLSHGRDTFGTTNTPLFVDGLHIDSLQPAVWKGANGDDWILSNFASQQSLLRLLDGLSRLTKDSRYRNAAVAATQHALEHLQSESGMLYWGGHTAWDLQDDRPVGQYSPFVHELKRHQPYYTFMWQVNPSATRKLMEGIWAGHILDWSLLDYNRHARIMAEPVMPQWNQEFLADIEVPFPATGKNLSFVNVTLPLMHTGVQLAILDKNEQSLTWIRRLVYRWQQARDPNTGLSGGQMSFRKEDRALEALGHVHPTINEARIVASYHQISRYHHLPLAQMQAAISMLGVSERFEEIGRELIDWASEDLKTYDQQCYDPSLGAFVARLTDGTAINWRESKKGYYGPESFRPAEPDGLLLWSHAMAYRLTGDDAHWQSVRQLGIHLGLSDLGKPSGNVRVRDSRADLIDWRLIYALLELHRATQDQVFLDFACRIADNILMTQSSTGLFPRSQRQYARTSDEIPLALLHLAAAIQGKASSLPQAMLDKRFFHCAYRGKFKTQQKSSADKRTYDNVVFYGDD